MTVEQALKSSETSGLDTEVLLAHLLGVSREWIVAHPEGEIPDTKAWQNLIERRKKNEPIAYITQKQEFYGRDFFVDKRVLIPRPSTERLIDLLFDFLEDEEDRIRELDTDVIGATRKFGNLKSVAAIVDLCTGSGCIAVTLALETDFHIIATDIDANALDVAKINAERHGVSDRITFLQGDLLQPLTDIKSPFLVITNPPYIPNNARLMPDVTDYEPHLALFGGADGNEVAGKILHDLPSLKQCRGIVMETGRETLR